MKEEMINAYLARAKEIIGDRTQREIAYDDTVVEALRWEAGNIDGIASHYDYLKEHARIMRLIGHGSN